MVASMFWVRYRADLWRLKAAGGEVTLTVKLQGGVGGVTVPNEPLTDSRAVNLPAVV